MYFVSEDGSLIIGASESEIVGGWLKDKDCNDSVVMLDVAFLIVLMRIVHTNQGPKKAK